jgi:hypothetical protein
LRIDRLPCSEPCNGRAGALTRAEGAIDKYLNWQFRIELKTSAKPMFVEMSGGVEKSLMKRNLC